MEWERVPEVGPLTYARVFQWTPQAEVAVPSLPVGAPSLTVWAVQSDGGVVHMAGPDPVGHASRAYKTWTLPPEDKLQEVTSNLAFQRLCGELWASTDPVLPGGRRREILPVSYTHLRAHET